MVLRGGSNGVGLALCQRQHSEATAGPNSDRARPAQVSLLLKRFFDVAVGIAGLAVFSPIFLLASALIKLDSLGPVLARSKYYGPNGRPFGLYRFRTFGICGVNEHFQATEYSSIGRLLRRSGIDGLPQLINVVRGEMSIVGPQPYLGASITTDNEALSQLKPGLTGWAQVNGHGGATETPTLEHRRLALDLFYAEHWSMLLDLRIVLKALSLKDSYLPAARAETSKDLIY
jgi:putative colanic acid biosynthesis UDP-glucose lipid carrier transferase